MKIKSLYIHIPFCSHKCLFCSFAIAVAQTHRVNDYLNKLEKEAEQYKGTTIETLYLGGGTPSLLEDNELIRLMGIIQKNFVLSPDCEMTIEANPESITASKAKTLKTLGFNRISLGIQSLNDGYLKFLGRKHDAQKAHEAYQMLRGIGFSNISLDLMYAFPSQSAKELEEDVRAIASMGSEHLSLYTLTIESNSRFHAQAVKLDAGEKITEHYEQVVQLLEQYGFHQYEVSNFAKDGFESKHNRNYWLGGEYIGLGMGAHGFSNARRYWNTEKFQDYLSKEDVVAGFEDLDDKTLIMEKVLFGLRMNEGIDVTLVPEDKKTTIDSFIQEGFLQLEGSRLKTTLKGRVVLDELSVRLI